MARRGNDRGVDNLPRHRQMPTRHVRHALRASSIEAQGGDDPSRQFDQLPVARKLDLPNDRGFIVKGSAGYELA